VAIVGVVSDMKIGLRGEPEPILLLPLPGTTQPVTLMVRRTTDAASMIPSVRRAMVCCLGIYGLLSYSVARRRAEISVRMAIGASAPRIVTMVVRESLVPVTIGIVLGAITATAAALPARSAARVDPLLALRQ
jgi:ABC-type antimicrobial peptide transport system permease subunit